MIRRRLATASIAMLGVLLIAQLITGLSGTASANGPLALLLTPAHQAAGRGKAPVATSAQVRRAAVTRVARQVPTAVSTRLIASLAQPDQLQPTPALVAQVKADALAAPGPAPAKAVAPVKAAPAALQVKPIAPAALAPLPASSTTVLNGVPIDQVVRLNDAVRQHLRDIFKKGQLQGRNPRAFAKIGDSTMAYPPLMADFGYARGYNLGRYAALQVSIDYYAGSFARESAAVKKGMHTWTEFDPSWAPQPPCEAGETPLACEFRLTNPSVAIIRLGANDFYDAAAFNRALRQIVDFCLLSDVIPVLGTKPDRQEGPQNTINGVIAQVAADYNLPLWDYDRIAATVPNRGLDTDNVHMLASTSHDFTALQTYRSGDPLEDLTALMMLDAIRQATH